MCTKKVGSLYNGTCPNPKCPSDFYMLISSTGVHECHQCGTLVEVSEEGARVLWEKGCGNFLIEPAREIVADGKTSIIPPGRLLARNTEFMRKHLPLQLIA
jgi:hypothetical protein